MKIKRAVSFFLLLFIGVSLAYIVIDASRPGGSNAGTRAESEDLDAKVQVEGTRQEQAKKSPEHVVIAYYFHSAQRCPTCLKIEAYSDESLKEGFVEELKTGKLEWYSLDMHLPENLHFIDDFKLTTSSLILVDRFRGEQKEWKNLEDIWNLVGDKPAFFSYVQKEARSYLNNNHD